MTGARNLARADGPRPVTPGPDRELTHQERQKILQLWGRGVDHVVIATSLRIRYARVQRVIDLAKGARANA